LLYDELRKRDVPAKLVLVPGVGHYFDKGTVEQGRDILNTTIGFLDSTVGAPSKP
jgi:dipeptidyl aminopeptidase/acylaminoacyl peptidase